VVADNLARHLSAATSRQTTLKHNKHLPLWPLALLAMGIFGYLTRTIASKSVLASDPVIFLERVRPILDGELPYVDTLYEHFPLALPPMIAARLVPGGDGNAVYVAVFGSLMMICLILTAVVVCRAARPAGILAGDVRWTALVAPLVPLVTFRIDPLATLLAVMAFALSFVALRPGALWTGLAAVATKGWPVVLAPVEWWAGRRKRAVIIVGFTVVLVGGLLFTPGFQEGRDFSGIQLETIAGSVLIWLRSIAGGDSGLFTAAGAAYVEAPAAALLVGVVLAGATLWFTRSIWRREVTVAHAAQAVGVITMALLLFSPLLSAQFLVWLTPWLVFFPAGRSQPLFVVLGGVTLVLLLHWAPHNVVWQSGLLVRNGLLLATAVEMIREVRLPAINQQTPGQRATQRRPG